MITLMLLTTHVTASGDVAPSTKIIAETATEKTEIEKIKEELNTITIKPVTSYGWRDTFGRLSAELKEVIEERNVIVRQLNALIERAKKILPISTDVSITVIEEFKKEIKELENLVKLIKKIVGKDRSLLEKEKTALTRFGSNQRKEVEDIIHEEETWQKELNTITNLWGRWLEEVHKEIENAKDSRKVKSLYATHKQTHEKVLNTLHRHLQGSRNGNK